LVERHAEIPWPTAKLAPANRLAERAVICPAIGLAAEPARATGLLAEPALAIELPGPVRAIGLAAELARVIELPGLERATGLAGAVPIA
jgi:hypothetical protein